MTRKVDPAGVLDMNGAESADAALHSTTWVYGVNRTVADSRAVTRMAKDGGHWVYTYADGVLVAKEDPNGAKTQHLFYLDVPTTDPRYGLPKEDITPIDATTLRVTAYVSYDATGKPTEIKSFPRTSTGDGALDRHLLYSYDTYGRMTSTTDLIVGTTTSIAYVMTDGQETVTLTAPKLTPADASGPQTVLVYRSDGQLERITDPLGRQSVYGYTATGFLSTITDTSSGIVATLGGFDNLGRPQTVTVSKSGQPDRVTTLDYDALGRLTSNTRGKDRRKGQGTFLLYCFIPPLTRLIFSARRALSCAGCAQTHRAHQNCN